MKSHTSSIALYPDHLCATYLSLERDVLRFFETEVQLELIAESPEESTCVGW